MCIDYAWVQTQRSTFHFVLGQSCNTAFLGLSLQASTIRFSMPLHNGCIGPNHAGCNSMKAPQTRTAAPPDPVSSRWALIYWSYTAILWWLIHIALKTDWKENGMQSKAWTAFKFYFGIQKGMQGCRSRGTLKCVWGGGRGIFVVYMEALKNIIS